MHRVHTIWFDTGSVNNFVPPTLDPPIGKLPTGTQVTMAFRGATGIQGSVSAAQDARNFDPYGEAGGVTPQYVNGAGWKPDISSVNGARFLQVRISIVSSVESLLTPEINTISFAYSN